MNRYSSNNKQQVGIKDWILIGFIGWVIVIIWSYFQGGKFLFTIGTIWMFGLTFYKILEIKRNKVLALTITDDYLTVIQKNGESVFNWKAIEVFKTELEIAITDKSKKCFGIYKSEWDDFADIKDEFEEHIELKMSDKKPQSLVDTIANALLVWS